MNIIGSYRTILTTQQLYL